jgi:hypothetical protein
MKLRLLFIWSFIHLALIALTIMSRRISRRSAPQAEKVACPNPIWLTENSLREKFDYNKAHVANLRKIGSIYHENSSHTISKSCRDDDPYYGVCFYSVDPTTGVGCGGSKQYVISLNFFVDLCKALERCCKENCGLSQAARNNLLLYYGRDIPNIPTTDDQAPSIEFIRFVQDTLRQGKFIVFSEDLPEKPPVPSNTIHAPTTTVCQPCSADASTSAKSSSANVAGNSGATNGPDQMRCKGIQSPRLEDAVKTRGLGAEYVRKYWNITDGNIVSKQCTKLPA